MRIQEDENYAGDDDVVANIAEQINGGIQVCIDKHILSCSIASRCFIVRVEVIIPCIGSSARDILVMMFGKNYSDFATAFGLKINGRSRGHKTLVEIDT